MLRFEPLPLPEDTVFLEKEDVDYFHDQVLEAGQLNGYKCLNDLLGAIGRPQNALYYEEGCDLVRVAAYYWHGISTSHGYIDGNKRTGFACANNFLLMNGVAFEAPDYPLGPMIEKLFEEGQFKVEILEDILRRHCHWL